MESESACGVSKLKDGRVVRVRVDELAALMHAGK